jgi:putative transposase
MPLNVRVFDCPCCHLSIHRDLNASLNVLRVGLDSLGIESVEAPAFMRGE